jgi:hypothetical protein
MAASRWLSIIFVMLGGERFIDPDEEAFRQAQEQEILTDPTRDYYDEFRAQQPKYEIGEYVASFGFNVPLIRDLSEWQAALDGDEAMLRSEAPQDYSGYSGILASKRIHVERVGFDGQATAPWLDVLDSYDAAPDYRRKYGQLLYEGLRGGNVNPGYFLKTHYWDRYGRFTHISLGVEGIPPVELYDESASSWRSVAGTNIRVFRDPNVDGRYHMGLMHDRGFIAGYTFDKEHHDAKVMPDRATKEVKIAQVIELYEAVRTLPRFDQRQVPLMELQLDEEGQLHFLQYLKTGQQLELIEPFPLPASDGIHTDNVRGITPPEGKEFKMYISPRKATKQMKGEGFYFDIFHIRGLATQFYSMIGGVVVHEAYVSMKDNHFGSAPLYRPGIALGLRAYRHRHAGKKLQELVDDVQGKTVYDRRPDRSLHVNAKVTSNGREAVLESDFEPHYEEVTQL